MHSELSEKVNAAATKYAELLEMLKKAQEQQNRDRTDTEYVLEVAGLVGAIKASTEALEEEIIAVAQIYRITSPELSERLNTSPSTIARRWKVKRH